MPIFIIKTKEKIKREVSGLDIPLGPAIFSAARRR
jgi:hypothetical protein